MAVWSSGTRRPSGQEDVFWTHDNQLWEAVPDNGWQPSPVPGISDVASAPVAAVDAALDEEVVYWTGTDNQL